MATLKGQNVRILLFDNTEDKFKVVGMATNCSVTLNNETEDVSTKDNVGLASMPSTTSKSWSVSVESLNVTDAGAMLTAIKAMQPFTLLWDEVSTEDNQNVLAAAFQRIGEAFLNDVTLTFNDRENSAKSLQFQGTGGLEHDSTAPAETIAVSNTYTKGQFVRLFLSSNNTAAPDSVVAAARTLQMHISLALENSTTKDTTGDWQVQQPTGLSYDISTGALVRGNDTITSQVGAKTYADIQTLYEAGTPFKWKIANVGGANNRTASSTIVSGSILITSLQLNNPNRQNSEYTMNANGYGDYTVGS